MHFGIIMSNEKTHKTPAAIPLIPLLDNEFLRKIFFRPFSHKAKKNAFVLSFP